MPSLLGTNDAGYFIGRKEILAWIQNNFQPNLSRLEDLASGAVYCQIVDSVYPQKVGLNKVKFGAKREDEVLQNYKLLQSAFQKYRIERRVDVNALKKRSFQNHLEFGQFMYRWWDKMGAPDYDWEEAARSQGVNLSTLGGGGGGSSASPAKSLSLPRMPRTQSSSASAGGVGRPTTSASARNGSTPPRSPATSTSTALRSKGATSLRAATNGVGVAGMSKLKLKSMGKIDYARELEDIYAEHAPDKVNRVSEILSKYRGREEELMSNVRAKYGLEGPNSAPSRGTASREVSRRGTQSARGTTTSPSASRGTASSRARQGGGGSVNGSSRRADRNGSVTSRQQRAELEDTAQLKLISDMQLKLNALQKDNDELKSIQNALELERDVYYGKLREIELMCEDCKSESVATQSLLNILYHLEESFEYPPEPEPPQTVEDSSDLMRKNSDHGMTV